MAGIPNMPRNMRELMAVTATDEDCRQWLVQQQLLAANMQCPCGAACILQRFSRSVDGKVQRRSCLIIIAFETMFAGLFWSATVYLPFSRAVANFFSSYVRCFLHELMKAVRQTAYWYCPCSMQNGVYENVWRASVSQSCLSMHLPAGAACGESGASGHRWVLDLVVLYNSSQ